MHIIYSTPSGDLHVITGVPKAHLEAVFGPISDEQYADMVMQTVPQDAINPREVPEVPADRTFRAAWADISADAVIDVSPSKAKSIALSRLRERRNAKLASLDGVELAALGSGDSTQLAKIRADKAVLRAVTDPLKALVIEGDIAGDNFLAHVKELMEVEL